MRSVRDSQEVLPSRRLGAVSDGCHRGTLSLHVLVQGRSIEETLRVTTSTDELEVKVLPHMAESCVGVLINNSTVGTESKLPAPPGKLNDCLMRHSCWWKFDKRNSLSVPTRNSGGTTAVKLGAPWLVKEDSTAGRYFYKPLRVYKGTQSAMAVNWSRGHSMRRPSLLRIGSQWSVITSGRSD